MTTTTPPGIITRYFTAQIARDFDTMVELFAADATVIDEGHTHRGPREIRAWRDNVASVYEYTTELTSVEPVGDATYLAIVHLEGNFPGGQADLRFHFTLADDRINRLEITP